MMDEFSRRRWHDDPHPEHYSPVQALKKMVEDIEEGIIDPDYVVVCYTTADDKVGFYQAGPLFKGTGIYGPIGLLTRVQSLMFEEE